jgi:Domain of unknown function (DUF4340)
VATRSGIGDLGRRFAFPDREARQAGSFHKAAVMEKILGILGVFLALIFVSAVVLTTWESGKREARQNIAMFETAPEAVDRIRVAGPDGAEALIVRAGNGWVLPDLGDFPADARKVDDALARLLTVKANRPVGSSEAELIAFRLAGDDFERRITLAHGDSILAAVYLGTPQGPRQVHARRADQSAAYDIDFGLYDAPADAAEWIDKGVLQLPLGEIAVIEVAGLRLVPAGSAAGAAQRWQLDGDSAARLKPSGAARLADLVAQLRIDRLAGPEAEPDDALDTPQLSLSVTRIDGRRIDYRLGKADLDEDYTLAVSTRPERFRLSARAARRLIDAALRDSLLEPAAPQHAATGAPAATRHN